MIERLHDAPLDRQNDGRSDLQGDTAHLAFPLLSYPPRRGRLPGRQFLRCPVRRLVRMTGGARIWNLVFFCHRRRNELEGMRTDEGARHALGFDLRHVAGYAPAAGTAVFVVGVFLETRGVRAIGRRGAMTIQAERVHRFSELRIVLRAMHIVAGRACDAVLIHDALHEVIPLHPVLVGGSVGEVGERRLA